MVHPPKDEADEIVILTADQMSDVLGQLDGHRLLPIIALALGAGLRRGELCALRWGDVDLAVASLRVEYAMEQTRTGLN